MNKKFLSALFLESIIAAGGTFTACSDYDDDIDSLNQRVDAVEQAVTDLNGTSGKFDKLLSAVTSNIVFSFDQPTTAQIQGATHYLGTLNYENNGTTVGDFQIQVPFDVTYDWGTIRVYVVCKISQTEAN